MDSRHENETCAAAADVDKRHLPPLSADRAFWGMTATQFLGAFNDNLFKQFLLLLALDVSKQRGAGSVDLQWIAMFVFSVPFLLFSGYAGYLADRFGKRLIIILSKVAEIVVMLLGMIGFLLFGVWGFVGMLVVLWLMGTQSAFFGPSKYGILPEMLRRRDLPQANGFILMTTFLAIIFGAGAAGALKDLCVDELQPVDTWGVQLSLGSAACVLIAIVGTLTALTIRRVRPANPTMRLTWGALTIPADMRALLLRDRSLLAALVVSSMFWLVAGVAHPTVNSVGDVQFELADTWTSILPGCIALGIMIGSLVAGAVTRGRVDFLVVRIGAWGVIGALATLSLLGQFAPRSVAIAGTAATLILLGAAAGMFAVPVQVFLQARPPDNQKGRMIAVMNQANFTGIILSAVIYLAFDRLVAAFDWPRSSIFALTALLMLPVALLYHPKSYKLDE